MTRFLRIRRQYPCPVVCGSIGLRGLIRSYCVGGAALLSLAPAPDTARFPDRTTLAELFRACNRALTPRESEEFAEGILKTNDMGNFSDAWALLATALGAYGQEEVGDDSI